MKKERQKLSLDMVQSVIINLFCIFIMMIGSNAYGNQSTQHELKLITLSLKEKTLKQLFDELHKQTNVSFFYSNVDIDVNKIISINTSNDKLENILNKAFYNTNYEYEVVNKDMIVVRVVNQDNNRTNKVNINGKVVNIKKEPLTGVTIAIKGSNKGVITDENGNFTIKITKGAKTILRFSFIGMKTREIEVSDNSNFLNIVLQQISSEIDEVVVTGIYRRKKESFTGSASTYTIKDLKSVGSINILQSLKTLDPTFAMIDSKRWGSDPNRLPNIEIRGTTSIAGLQTEFGEDPNRPLFILDGVETSLQTIVNLNMDRVANITVLKDAASTAIYGSKAANGVIVVETVQPKQGELRISYNSNLSIQMPDLSDYNLMNAREKLEFERLAGVYEGSNYGSQLNLDNEYTYKYKEILRGVDTYWLSQPLRTALNHTHNINVDGGDRTMRYAIGVNYNGRNGVMKGSENSSIGASINLVYRTKKLLFSNMFYTSISKSEREPVSFSEYSKQNPYTRIYNSDGYISKYIDTYDKTSKILNPVYLSSLNNNNDNRTNSYNNTFNIEYRMNSYFRLSGLIYINQDVNKIVDFTSPFHPKFDKIPKMEKGSYEYMENETMSYGGNAKFVFGKIFDNIHQVNLVGGWDFREHSSTTNGYTINGFVSDLHENPQFSSGFKAGQSPLYSKNISRETSFFFNGNYGYKNKYLFDANLRMDGTSRFGSNKLFSTTWSIGIAWNLHNENFVKELEFISNLRIRYSIGNPGNQNFDPYLAFKTYKYNTKYQNMFGPSAIIFSTGNKYLKWQRTIDRNIGFDLSILDNRIRINVDFYNKKTDPLLIDILMPISSGTTTLKSNLGGLSSKGTSGSIVAIIKKNNNWRWSINYNFRIGSSEYYNIGNSLNDLNNKAKEATDPNNESNILKSLKESDALKRYYDGGNPNDLYAVRSLGIDPATGREVFFNKENKQVFVYNHEDQIKVGNSRPDIEGVIGSTISWKNLSCSFNFRYSLGSDILASAIFNKVENISREGLNYNQDKRALYNRWKKPGDISKFSSIRNIKYETQANISDRFLMSENTIELESLSLRYIFESNYLHKIGINGADFSIYMNNIFRLSSVKEERGLEYPFSRTVVFSLGIRL